MRPIAMLVTNWQDRLNPRSGGAETHLHEVFGRLAQRGHQVTLLTSRWHGAPEREMVDGIDVHRVGDRYSFAIAAPRYYRRALAQERFDIVVEDLNKIPLFSPRWARSPVLLLVHHLFGLAAFRSAGPAVAALTLILERLIPHVYRDVRVHAVSESTATELAALGMRRDRIAVVHNGVDAARLTPGGRAARSLIPMFAYVGRLERYKRVDLMLDALAVLRREGRMARLIIAGRGREERPLRERAAALGIDDIVSFAGFISEDEKVKLLRAAWANLFTSTKEGWGIGALEAAACGTPTIASDVPGLRESVIDRKTGLLVRHGGVEALADAMRFLILYPEYTAELGVEARLFAQRFSWDSTADQTEAELYDLLGRSSYFACSGSRSACHDRAVSVSNRSS